MYCSKCGEKIHDEAEICPHCGCRVKEAPTVVMSDKDTQNAVRFVLTFFLGFIGSFIINHTDLKPKGWTCRTLAYFFLSIITFGLYQLIASVFNFAFDPEKGSNVGYFRD